SAAGRPRAARPRKRTAAPPHWPRASARRQPRATITARPNAPTTTARRSAQATIMVSRRAPRRHLRSQEVSSCEHLGPVVHFPIHSNRKAVWWRWMSVARVTSIGAALLAAITLCSTSVEAARPKTPFFWPFGPLLGDPAPSRHSHRHRQHSRPKAAKTEQAREAAKGPLQIIISIADQRISVYDDGVLIGRSAVSTGVPGHPTPVG